jgi:hypothetical protein
LSIQKIILTLQRKPIKISIMRGIFESESDFAKRTVNELICSIHKKRVKLSFDYDRDENAIPYISKCCCKAFAQEVADALYQTGAFDIIYLEHKTGLTPVDIIIHEDGLTFV